MNSKLEDKISYLIKNIPQLIKSFSYREGPDLYFYRRLMELRKKSSLEVLFDDNYFFELLYATLTAWDMNARGAKMKYFDEFKENLIRNEALFFKLEKYKLSQIAIEQFSEIKNILSDVDYHINH